MDMMQEFDVLPPLRDVVSGALRGIVWIAAATLVALWAGDLWRPLGVALAWVEVIVAVGTALRFTGVATVDLVLVAIGYQGDRYDLGECATSRSQVFARIVEMTLLVASIVYVFHSLHV